MNETNESEQIPIETLLKRSYNGDYDGMSADDIERVLETRATAKAERQGFLQTQKAIDDALQIQQNFYKEMADSHAQADAINEQTYSVEQTGRELQEEAQRKIDAVLNAAGIEGKPYE